MSPIFLLIPVLLPMLAAVLMISPRLHETRRLNRFVLIVTLLTSAAALIATLDPPGEALTILQFSPKLSISLHLDGLGRIYAGILLVLWPITAIYSFDYMAHEEKLNRFYAFFMLSYGVALGIAFSGNMITMYLFFELLTLVTLPLVMHKMDDTARYAGKRYLLYSMSGAALGLIGVVFLARYGSITSFSLGGTLNLILMAGHEKLLRSVFVVAFFGFGVKAALMPLSFWLPTASVAPTPVTALLHAVAVVKAGAFACIRLIYYGFGTELLKNTPAQQIVISAAAFTIVAGSVLALRENHMKRRLAWSTVSNLSYILLAAAMMSGAGLIAGCKHMIAHAFIKITLFFCVGAVMEKTGCSHIDEIEGLGKRMPVTFACFALASAALIGLPPLPGFYSKWAIGLSAMEQGGVAGYLGMAALMISALLTALYTMGILVPAVFPLKRNGMQPGAVCESATMNGVLIFLCCAIIAIGVLQGPLNELLIHLLEGGVY